MGRQRTSDPICLWRSVEQAGGIDAYVDQQLREQGFLVERRETDNMSKRELAQYKKQLKEEAARQGKTMSELVETALRSLFQQHRQPSDLPPLPSFDSGGAHVDVSNRESMYEFMERP